MNKIYADSTLKSMTKDNLIEIIRCLESNIEGLQEMNDRQFNILMKQDIFYEWHDLRKTPRDLPTDEAMAYLTAHKICGSTCYTVCNYKDGYFSDGINPSEMLNKSVLAWKVINWMEE